MTPSPLRSAACAASCCFLGLLAAGGCFKGEASPLHISVGKGVRVTLPGEWRIEKTVKKEAMSVTRLSRGDEARINIVSLPARDIPFERQVAQDRNNLNIESGYTILHEKNAEVQGRPAYVFVVTFVREGKRFKAKIVSFRKEKTLFYFSLYAGKDAYPRVAREFEEMIRNI